MNLDLYFLRSSESKIVTDMVAYARPDSHEEYTKFYGLTTKDLGLYALKDSAVVGAIWSREIKDIPQLSLAVLPAHRKNGIASSMLAQFLLEAGELYEEIEVEVTEKTRTFYEKHNFCSRENSHIMYKQLEKKEIVRPNDGYDSSKWMD